MDSPPLEGCLYTGVVSKVYINDTQYFDNVPQIAWGFTLAIINQLKNGSKTERKEHLIMMIFYTIIKLLLHYQKQIDLRMKLIKLKLNENKHWA